MNINMQYWVWLTTVKGITIAKVDDLITVFGNAKAVFEADNNEIRGLQVLGAELISEVCKKDLTDAQRILQECEALRVRLLCVEDERYPENLRQINCPPKVLYYRGRFPNMDNRLLLSVIGTRNPTPYGRYVADRLCTQLARSGIVIVSGMASGLDGAANRAALNAGKPTFAILGSGIDVIYPFEHEKLYYDIIGCGAVISEYPPGTKPSKFSFPQRNRIISGMSQGTLVIEAGERSGTLITASYAIEQNRELFAVPGNIDSASSRGTNALIRDGAKIVMDMDDILSEFRERYGFFSNDVDSAQQGAEALPDSDGDAAEAMAESVEGNAANGVNRGLIHKLARRIYRSSSSRGAKEVPAQSDVPNVAGEKKSDVNSGKSVTAARERSKEAEHKKSAEQKTQNSIKPKNNIHIINTGKYEFLSDDERILVGQLTTSSPINTDEICKLTGFPPAKVSAMLTMLELGDIITVHPGKMFTIK